MKCEGGGWSGRVHGVCHEDGISVKCEYGGWSVRREGGV